MIVPFSVEYLDSISFANALTDEEKGVLDLYAGALDSYVQENVMQFIHGTKSLDMWENYVAQIETLGVDKVLEVYAQARNRVMGK